ncbi:MAG: MATE family efflux transporter [Alphaproteobacteria bacterium]|nr:MATE family efflux transporter [Alphaproteobacteria bacterium]
MTEGGAILPGAAPKASWNRRIWALAGPIILSNVTIPLLGMVDTAVVGHLPDPRYIGGVAIGALIFNFVYWGFGFLRMGTTGPTAQAWGAGDAAEIRAVLARALLLALGLGVVLLIVQGPVGALAFRLLHASAEVEGEGAAYYAVRIWGAPAALANYVLLGWFFGLQNARWPLVLQIFMNGLNIALDLVFVMGLGWGVEGVAAATLIAEYAALGLGLVLVAKRLGMLGEGHAWGHILEGARFRRMLAVNRDIFIRTLLLITSFALFTDRSATLGDVTLAANAVLLNLVSVSAFALDGFAHAAEALVGGAVGRRSRADLAGAVRATMRWGGIAAVITAAAFAAAGGLMIDLLTTIPEVRFLARAYLPWAVAMPLISVWCYLFDGIFLGATRTHEMRNAAILTTALYVAALWILLPLWGNHGLWLALVCMNALRGLTLAAYYPRLARGVAG